MDIKIKNGKVLDGTGNPWSKSDIGVEDGKIIEIGNLRGVTADRVVDASGLVVCPGFIDIHSHSDFYLVTNPTMDAKIYQGVTTELNGNCGISQTPLIGLRYPLLARQMRSAGIDPEWSNTRQYFQILEDKGHSTNTANLVGYGNVRVPVMGMVDREPNEYELDLMKALVTRELESGLFGLSTGLWYPPNSFATTEELIELCKVVAKYGGTYVTHIRSESRLFVEAIEEAIKIGEGSGVNVQCVHHKAYGKNYGYKIPITLGLIDKARDKGIDITLDVYPYVRDSGNFTGWLPAWAHEGGPKMLLKRLQDAETREKIKGEIDNQIEEPRPLISTAILTTLHNHPELSGKNVGELAEEEGMDVLDYVIQLLINEEGRGVGISSEFGTEENLKKVLSHPASMIGSDGSGVSIKVEEWKHPRNYGTYARVMGKYVRDEGTLTLQEAIRKCTSFPAQRLGLKERGLIREGMWADITIFDYNKIHDNFSLTKPNQYAEGIEYVLVNGTIVIDKGKHTGKLPGKILKRDES